MHGNSLVQYVLTLGTLLKAPFVLVIFFHHIGVVAVWTGAGNRFVVGYPFTFRIARAGIEGTPFFAAPRYDLAFSALGTGDAKALGTRILALGIGGTCDECSIFPVSLH
jgi:hypothetical protein